MNIQQVRHIMEDLGAYGHGSFWRVETPLGPLEWDISLRGRSKFARVAVDRIFTEQPAPPQGREWAKAHLAPIVQAGAESHATRSSRGYWYSVPACIGIYSMGHVLKDDLEEFLRLWVPQETRWILEAAERDA